MNLERIKQLEKFIVEQPDDPFNRYALALEWADEDPALAARILMKLIGDCPQYVPSYYQAALALLELNRMEEAKIVLQKGIEAARQRNDQKAASELKGLADELD